jgi:CcmD family protein
MKKIGFTLCALMHSASAFAQPGQSEFIPVTELPSSEQLPAAPLLIAAYAFVWLAFLGYAWVMWRRLGKVEGEIATLSTQLAKRRP